MKLVSVQIFGDDFRALPSGEAYPFHISDRTDRLSTKCIAGLNGSGKSNMLELVAEIFYKIEYYLLESGSWEIKQQTGFGFEIQYLKHCSRADLKKIYPKYEGEGPMHIVIRKKHESNLELPFDRRLTKEEQAAFERQRQEENLWEFLLKPEGAEDTHYRIISEYADLPLLLPNRIIGYTSGQNELLSNPFYKLKYHYLNEMRQRQTEFIPDRMLFIDTSSTQSLFIANLLLASPQKITVFEQAFKLQEKDSDGFGALHSFRITINLHKPDNTPVNFTQVMLQVLDKLKSCSTSWAEIPYYKSQKRKQLVLDYFVTDATRAAFAFHFKTALNLFQSFYQLETLNLETHKTEVHKLVYREQKHLHIVDELPAIEPDNRVFSIGNIRLRKAVRKYPEFEELIRYKQLSDGEHQFNEVIGSLLLLEEDNCLLLLDEPDTHFNPKWRASIIRLFNEMAAVKKDRSGKVTQVRNHEIMMTTHSPFAISDSDPENVYCFRRDDKTQQITITAPTIPTYGASVQSILEHVFDKDATIANLAQADLESIRKEAQHATDTEAIDVERSKLIGFGESIEKFDTIRFLRAMENELKNK